MAAPHGASHLEQGARKQLLTFAAITDATGESEHGQLEEIELIFGAFDKIEPLALRQCWNLQRLTLINCRLSRISGLDSVGTSLLHLCLSDQQITRIDGLAALVNLRSLCLQQNQIERIEGLANCRKLQKLWLYGNRIQRLENLAACSDLRELWLQDNAIQTLDSDGSGVSTLVNLASLHVANNRIRSIEELQHLRKLTGLSELSFTDEHFGSNPIAAHPDYRSLAITTLKHLSRLDGAPIGRSERVDAEDQFLAQALEFNDKLAELTLAYETELRGISGRRERGLSNAQMLQSELLEALNELERCVQDGQQQIRSEKQRQQDVRDSNTQLLEDNVARLKQRFHARIDHQAAREASALRREELQLEALEQEAVAEHRLARCLTMLQYAAPSRVALQHLPEHSSDFRYIASHFQSQQCGDEYEDDGDGDGGGESLRSALQLLQMYRFFHCDLTTRFDEAAAIANSSDTGTGAELYLYLVASECELPQWLQHGLTQCGRVTKDSSSGDAGDNEDRLGDWLFLFSDPLQALTFYHGAPGTALLSEHLLDAADSPVEATEPRIESFQLLLCRVRMAQTIELFYPETRHLTSLEALHAVATPQGSILQPPPSAFLQLELGDASGDRGARHRAGALAGSSHVYVARRSRVGDLVLPQFLVLCSKRLTLDELHVDGGSHDDGDDNRNGEDGTSLNSASSVLDAFQRALDDEVAAFHTRLVAEIDPAHVRFRSQLLDQTKQLDERLKQQRTQIEREKKLQDQLVRAIHADPAMTARRG